MKKTYISPKTESVVLNCEQHLAAGSGTMSGDGLNMSIKNKGASGDAEGRGSLGWDDEE